MRELTFSKRDYLLVSERRTLIKLSRTAPVVWMVLDQLDRILASRSFARSRNTTNDFLRFIVSKTLLGRSDEVKEMSVAIRVFHEHSDFNPVENSKVRVAGWALRKRLAAYYETEGSRDRIQIIIPPGTYAPQILLRDRPRRLCSSGKALRVIGMATASVGKPIDKWH